MDAKDRASIAWAFIHVMEASRGRFEVVVRKGVLGREGQAKLLGPVRGIHFCRDQDSRAPQSRSSKDGVSFSHQSQRISASSATSALMET